MLADTIACGSPRPGFMASSAKRLLRAGWSLLIAIVCVVPACSPPARSPDVFPDGRSDESTLEVASDLPASANLDEDFALWRETYELTRSASSDSICIAKADAIASEAETQWLLGDREQAEVLWGEAFDLLSGTCADTILVEPVRPPDSR